MVLVGITECFRRRAPYQRVLGLTSWLFERQRSFQVCSTKDDGYAYRSKLDERDVLGRAQVPGVDDMYDVCQLDKVLLRSTTRAGLVSASLPMAF